MAFAKLGDNDRAWELFSIINPINHARTSDDTDIYKVEPYVIAADVYAIPPHTGRGGWTWYTGSASWMYRLILESLLGMKQEKGRLHFTPCLPADWEGFTIHYRYRETLYHITIQQLDAGSGEPVSVSVDEVLQKDNCITLVDDHTEHRVVVKVVQTTVQE